MYKYLYYVLNLKLKYMYVKIFIVNCIYILYVIRRYLVYRINKWDN